MFAVVLRGAAARRCSRLLSRGFPPFGDCRGGVYGFAPLEKRVYRAFVDHLREALEGYGWQTGENLAQALSPRTDGPALARRAPRRSGSGQTTRSRAGPGK